jgi:hypothetical protein
MMEKVLMLVRKLLALGLVTLAYLAALSLQLADSRIGNLLLVAFGLLLFAFLDYRITGEKPRFLFGLNQSDTFLNAKGGFWNLFKWIVNLLGLLYDLVVWVFWGVYLVFVLFAELLLFIKTILFWIIHAVIWFVRQLFPPFIFIFRMLLHYLVNWSWWIYQLTFRNMKTGVKRNFYFIALWGTVPALFIVFLFYAIGQLVGIPELVAVSAVFAIIPLVWSWGEISLLRFEGRENDPYSKVRGLFRNGFDAVRSVLFYLLIALVIIVAEIVLNLLGWIPNLSMSLLGITLNLNMALSVLLVFLAVLIAFAGSILPTHILYRPEHDNDLKSSLGFLQVIGRRFLRYLFAEIPAAVFGSLLLVLPVAVMLLAASITRTLKNDMLDTRIGQLTEQTADMDGYQVYLTDIKIKRLEMYKKMPELAPVYFEDIRSPDRINALKNEITSMTGQLDKRSAMSGEEDLEWKALQKESIATMKADLKELKRVRLQMPVLYLFVGILYAFFGGIVLAVYIAYMGNVYFELYTMREDGKPTYWCQTVRNIREKDPNQPLLGFTLLVIISAVILLIFQLT